MPEYFSIPPYLHTGTIRHNINMEEAKQNMKLIDDFYALIPAGGSGSRLWPVSRKSRPKFLYDFLDSGQTLLQSTYDRLAGLAGEGHVAVGTGVKHVGPVLEQLPQLVEENIFAEPVGRDSTAVIALAAAVLARRHGDKIVIGSFAADQIIRDRHAFAGSVREAVEVARAGYVTTIGIAASRPSTAFGYIRYGHSLAGEIPSAPSSYTVRQFVEKPDAQTAQAYLMTGEYRWNAGMFVMRADVLLNALAEFRPDLFARISRIADAWDTSERDSVVSQQWEGIEKIAFDYAVAEPLSERGGVAMVPGGFGWDDIGDFNSLAALLPSRTNRNLKVLGDADNVISRDSAGDIVVSETERAVALLGVDDMIVVDTDDVLLVAPRARSQEVKQMTAQIAKEGREDLL